MKTFKETVIAMSKKTLGKIQVLTADFGQDPYAQMLDSLVEEIEALKEEIKQLKQIDEQDELPPPNRGEEVIKP